MKISFLTIMFYMGICCVTVQAQNITLFEQFNGRYDYIAIGNTLNPSENNNGGFCTIQDASSALLNLQDDFTLIKAYLYWAGSGLGDDTVTLNNTAVVAENTYNVTYQQTGNTLTYFSSYANITDLILQEGNTTYTLTDLNINDTLLNNTAYCNNATNFGGWCIYLIYESENLPLNQVSLFQGLEIINRNQQEKNITLNNINVLDTNNAKIGFLAWEGDNSLNYGERLKINDNILENLPLNPPNNAFNSTNSFTNSDTLYNMDIDVYTIENTISIGDTSVDISLTTGAVDDNGILRADLILINNVITVLNSQLPDATITINTTETACNTNTVSVDYTVFNTNSTASLPAETPIAFYNNNTLIGAALTNNSIAINGSENGVIELPVDVFNTNNLTIVAVVDDIGTMIGTVTETNETNNISEANISLAPPINTVILPNLHQCDTGFGLATFNLLEHFDSLTTTPYLKFYNSLSDLETDTNPILMPSHYQSTSNPQHIFAAHSNNLCTTQYTFSISTKLCPPIVPQGFSPNNDGINDWFHIKNLYTIFVNHKLKIYNRLGKLIFIGNNSKPWKGYTNKGKKVPVGTYYYSLELHEPGFNNLIGWVYVNY